MAFSLFFGVIMPTFQGIQDSVTRRLVDTNIALTTEVPLLVNNALRMIQDLHNFKVMEASVEYTTVQAQRQLSTMPGDWKESRFNPYIREWDGGSTPIEWGPSIEEMAKIFPLDDASITGQGKPRYVLWNQEAGTEEIQVYPYPDVKSNWAGGGDWRIVVLYWKYIPEMTTGTDTNWFTEKASEFLIFQSVAEGFYINFDEARGQMWEGRAGLQFKKAKKVDKHVRTNRQSDTLTPRFATRGSFAGGRGIRYGRY